MDDELCLIENDTTDLTFAMQHEKFTKLQEAVEDLLKIHVFPISRCDDISVFSCASGEHFNFHDLKSRNKWQFTYSKEGNLEVAEIPAEQMNVMLDFLKTTESIAILSELPENHKSFVLTINELSDDAQIFNFYEYDGRLFIELEGQHIKFEINNCFIVPFFHFLQTNIPQAANPVS
jgi:hypothetical protein